MDGMFGYHVATFGSDFPWSFQHNKPLTSDLVLLRRRPPVAISGEGDNPPGGFKNETLKFK